MASFWWSWLPARARRLSPPLFAVLSDGVYLLAWPAVGNWGPLLALAIGLLLGWRRPESWAVFTSSIVMMAIFAMVGGVSAALGAWLWLGYVIGDFVLFSHPVPAGHAALGIYALIHVRAPLLIGYALLAGLAVLVPLAGRQLSQPTALGIRARGSPPGALQAALHPIIAALATAAWIVAAPTLIRPVFTWQGIHPPVDAIRLQHTGWVLALLAAVVAAAREPLESLARTRPPLIHWLQARSKQPPSPKAAVGRTLPVEVALPLWAALGTFFMSGLLRQPGDPLILWSVLLLVGVLRGAFAHWAELVALVSRVPLLVRLGIGSVASLVVARAVIGMMWHHPPAFLAMASGIGASLVIMAALTADRGRPTPGPVRAPSPATVTRVSAPGPNH